MDLFTSAGGDFDIAVRAALTAYREAGMKAEIAQERPGFARLMIIDDAGRSVKVELGVDWRAHHRSGWRSALFCTRTTRSRTRWPPSTAEPKSATSLTLTRCCAVAVTPWTI